MIIAVIITIKPRGSGETSLPAMARLRHAFHIEARLSKFALETVFNPKITEWKLTYDGRNKEPISLPIKFPLLLLPGCGGDSRGAQFKILPHNFNELIDASVAHLRGEDFVIYPDFQTGGSY